MSRRINASFHSDKAPPEGVPSASILADAGATDEEGVLDSPPPAPSSLAEVGLPIGFLNDLLLKLVMHQGSLSASELASRAALPRSVVEEIVQGLRKHNLFEVEPGPSQNFAFRLTAAGKQRAEDALDISRYVGPAPVPVEQYVPMISRLRRQRWRVGKAEIRQALSHLVLSEDIMDMIGLAFHSGRAAIIYGSSGNGKTEIVTSLSGSVSERLILPYALFVNGQVIRVFDPLIHEVVSIGGESAESAGQPGASLIRSDWERQDNRWVTIKRPVVVVGGEFSLEDLELSYDAVDRVYVAPASVQAQGGTMVIDDLGRQRVRPADILNRWIVPLERGFDTLVLQTGGFVVIPFRVSLVLSSNLALEEILDEAHLRRIPYKIQVGDPTPEQFTEILRRVCDEKGIPFSDTGAHYLVRRLHTQCSYIRACFPRDIIQIIVEAAEYNGRPPELVPDLIDYACDLYLSHLRQDEEQSRDRPDSGGRPYPHIASSAASG